MSTTNANFGSLRILKIDDVPMVRMKMEMEDEVFDTIVDYGKEVSTKEDYFEIGMRKILTESINQGTLGKEPDG